MIAAPKAFMIDAASILLEAAVQQLFLVTNDNRFQANPDGEGGCEFLRIQSFDNRFQANPLHHWLSRREVSGETNPCPGQRLQDMVRVAGYGHLLVTAAPSITTQQINS